MIQIKQNPILLALLLMQVVLSLHTQSHQQLPQRYNQDAYLDGLQSRQNKLNDSMIKIKQRIDSLKEILNNPDLSSDDALVALQEGMAEERDALYNVEVFMNLPFNLTPCNSTRLSAEQRDSLLQEVLQVKKSLDLLKNQIVECENCTTTAQMSFQIQREENYLGIISDILNSNCTKVPNQLPPQVAKGLVDLSQSMYKNNLQASNWVYGNITEQQYRLQVFASSIKYNLTSCPLAKPYVNQQTLDCFDCPRASNYSLGEQTCICPSELFYNSTENQCIKNCKKSEVFNKATRNCDKKTKPVTPTPNNTDSVCPVSKPVWNKVNKICEPCPQNLPYFSQKSLSCIKCPKSTAWSESQKKCVKNCTGGAILNSQTQLCEAKQKCKQPTPFWNEEDLACEACPDGRYWNATLNQCLNKCTSDEKYNPQTKECQARKVQKSLCDNIKPIWNPQTYSCEICPGETPQWNETLEICEECPDQYPVFNYTTWKCIEKICPHGQKWNIKKIKCSNISGVCKPFEEYSFQNEICEKRCEDYEVYNPQTKICRHKDCNDVNPIWNEKKHKCEGCPDTSPIWNSTKKQCENCSEKNPYWNTNNKKCEQCKEDTPIYDQKSRSCKPCDKEIPIWNQIIKKCQACTQEKPIYNSTSKTCQPCDSKFPLWNNVSKKCQQCIEPTPVFNIKTRKCQPCKKQTPLYNKTTQKCESCKEDKPIYNSTSRACQPCDKSTPIWNSTIEQCQACPEQYPVFNQSTSQCTGKTCKKGQLWNIKKIKCSNISGTCKPYEQYSFQNEKCEKRCEDFEVYNPETEVCRHQNCNNTNPKWDDKLHKCEACEEKNPYWNSTKQQCQQCGVSSPQWNKTAQKCQACPQEKPIYNSTSKICQPCDSNFPLWNKVSKKCEQCIEPTPVFNLTTRKCQSCKKQTPFYNKTVKKCVQCTEDKPIYNKKKNICQPCPQQTPVWNIEDKICQIYEEPKKNETKINTGKPTPNKTQPTNPTSPLTPCPLNYTYFNNTCLPPTCTDPNMYYNSASLTCVCKPGYQFYSIYNSCHPQCKIGQYLDTLTLECKNIKPQCGQFMFVNASNQCQCLSGYVLRLSGTNCRFNCKDGFIYNAKTDNCQYVTPTCPSGQTYNAITKICEQLQLTCPPGSFLDSVNQQCLSCPDKFTYNPSTKQCEAEAVSICPSGYTYDSKTKLCELVSSDKCPSGLYYDQQTKTCKDLYITNPNSDNLISDNITAYRQKYTASRQSNSLLQDCVNPAPYYDQTLYACVQCPKDYPYYNLQTNKCQNCGDGTYNSEKAICEAKPVDMHPSLSRFIMNVV